MRILDRNLKTVFTQMEFNLMLTWIVTFILKQDLLIKWLNNTKQLNYSLSDIRVEAACMGQPVESEGKGMLIEMVKS